MNSLDNIVVVLDQPKDLVNVAGVIRVMMNMGVRRLRLVRPDEFDHYRITGIAHRSDSIVDAAEFFDDLPAALADVVFAVGSTARPRSAGLNYERPRALGPTIFEHAAAGPVAIVLGREDRGLTNESLDLCNVVAIIPTDAAYPSLNLAQACMVLLYEVFLHSGAASAPLPRGRRATAPATRAELEEMYAALEGGLAAIEFFKARKPESVMRTLRAILGQVSMDQRESRLLAAMGYETGHYVRRLLESAAGGHSSCNDRADSKDHRTLPSADPLETDGQQGPQDD